MPLNRLWPTPTLLSPTKRAVISIPSPVPPGKPICTSLDPQSDLPVTPLPATACRLRSLILNSRITRLYSPANRTAIGAYSVALVLLSRFKTGDHKLSRGEDMEISFDLLKRNLRSRETTSLTLSIIAPASSIFAFLPLVIAQTGTGAFLSFLCAGIISLIMAFVYSELSSTFPLAGGEYSIVWRTLGPCAGFIILLLTLITLILVISLIALSATHYMESIGLRLGSLATARIIIAIIGVISILNVKLNATVTSLFLLLEFIVLAALPVFGFTHIAQPTSELWPRPIYLSGQGAVAPVPATAIALVV